MKDKIITHILSFVLMMFFVVFLSFLSFQFELRSRNIFKHLDSINYYDKAYAEILSKNNDYIVNDDVKNLYKEYITKDLIKNDVRKIIGNIYSRKDYSVSHYGKLYGVIEKYNNDPDIDNKYATGINEIYKNNIFPSREFNLIANYYVSNLNILLISLIVLTIMVIVSLPIYIINKSIKPYVISVFASALILMLPFIFFKLISLFGTILYTNKYFTEFLIGIIENTVLTMFIISTIIVIFFIVYAFIDKKNN